MFYLYHKIKKNDIFNIKNINNQKRINHKVKANKPQSKSEPKKQMPQTNNMSSFTKQIISAANQINGVKRNNSSIQYFASRK